MVSRYTYALHARAAVLEGVMAGVLVTHDVVARKTLGASPEQLVLLTMAPGASWLLALLYAHRIQDVERTRLFLWAGALGRLPLLAVAAVAGPWPFLAVLVLQGLFQTALIPAQNAVYQNNYDPNFRGRLFGRAAIFGGLATAVVAIGTGWLMDAIPGAYRWAYPVAGVAGFGACLVYGSIRQRRPGGPPGPPPPPVAAIVPPRGPRAHAVSLLRDVRATVHMTMVASPGFRRFEVALWIYGLGFMCMQPVFALLFVDELHAGTTEAALARGPVFYAVNIAALAIAGRMYDRVGLERLSARACTILMVFAVSMAWVETAGSAIALFALYGLGMAGISITWSMGPVRYAPPGQAARFMAMHVFLVGLRAVVGHPLGGWVAARFHSTRPTFVLAAALFGLATVLMIRADRLATATGAPRATTTFPE